MTVFSKLLKQQMQLRIRHASVLLLPPIFLLILLTLVGLSITDIPATWVWVGLLLAMLMQLPSMFCEDLDDGTLIYLQYSHQLFNFIWAKFLAWWVGLVLPMLLSLPFVAILSESSFSQSVWLGITLLFASPTLLWLGMVGASLVLLAQQNTMVLIILILPLTVPIFLLSVYTQSHPIGLLLLFACMVFSTTVSPFVIRFALESSLQS